MIPEMYYPGPKGSISIPKLATPPSSPPQKPILAPTVTNLPDLNLDVDELTL
ncbi:hypothetical protein XANCAGTX0491_003851 [Xanthoria calcicola]